MDRRDREPLNQAHQMMLAINKRYKSKKDLLRYMRTYLVSTRFHP